MKRQKETQQQEITSVRQREGCWWEALATCAKRSREKALQLGDKEKNAVFMSLAQRKVSFVHRNHGISWMHISSNKDFLCVVDEFVQPHFCLLPLSQSSQQTSSPFCYWVFFHSLEESLCPFPFSLQLTFLSPLWRNHYTCSFFFFTSFSSLGCDNTKG